MKDIIQRKIRYGDWIFWIHNCDFIPGYVIRESEEQITVLWDRSPVYINNYSPWSIVLKNDEHVLIVDGMIILKGYPDFIDMVGKYIEDEINPWKDVDAL